MNEGYLGKFTLEGERAATDDHPVILHALPLASTATAAIAAGTLLKKVDISTTTGDVGNTVTTVTGANFAPLSATDTAAPCAVADKPCDPSGAHGETSVIAVMHGTVKTHLLKTSEGNAATQMHILKLMECGIFAV